MAYFFVTTKDVRWYKQRNRLSAHEQGGWVAYFFVTSKDVRWYKQRNRLSLFGTRV